MILGIDVGNTNIVAALVNENGIYKEYRYFTDKQESNLYHIKHLETLVDNQELDGIMISSVVPEINDCLKQACVALTGQSPIFACAELKTGLDIKYDNPKKLGADLITAAVGTVRKYGSPAAIVDIGTATTLCVINEKNEYLGGMIAPGPFTSMKALAATASQLPEIELTATDKVIGTNTVDCMKIGILTAHAAMIDGMLNRVIDSLKLNNVQLIATGGRCEDITNMCVHKMVCDKDLIFYGLYELYKMNCNGI
ncbi:MAG: type III pantothenate kinase [Eubacterium sp.]|nr:type III pantothenate kinase [Eubacterium sp.]